ncbi:MAG: hypothetical protein Q8Q42_02720 [Nanoarchaeota archaeon]|nr:hypothetical protein [Nanoarchaeota archaeon]
MKKKQTNKKISAEVTKEQKQKSYIMLGLVLILLVFSAVQAIQVDNLRDEVEQAKLSMLVDSSLIRQASSTQSAPAMVGGC